MTFSTPYLIYILEAYGLTFIGLGLFFCVTLWQWKKSIRQLEIVSRETISKSTRLYSKDFKNSGRRQRARPDGQRTRNLKGEE